MPLEFQAATANCGNDTFGGQACDDFLQAAESTGMMLINCQEIHLKKALAELKANNSNPNLVIETSELRSTHTKPGAFGTGMVSMVIYDKTRYSNVAFTGAAEVKGDAHSHNKGATVNSLVATDARTSEQYRLQIISGHLDSNSAESRVTEWRGIRAVVNPEVSSWEELVAKIPHAVVAGYDANTRDAFVPARTFNAPLGTFNEFKKRINLWHSSNVDGRIAALALAPLGDQLYSANDTYKFKLDKKTGEVQNKVYKEDEKRKGNTNSGSLDFVAVQVNTSSEVALNTPGKRYQDVELMQEDAAKNIKIQAGSKRDHNVIVSPRIIVEQASDFERVRNHIIKQLHTAHPEFTQRLAQLEDSQDSRDILLHVYNQILQPNAALDQNIAQIDINNKKVAPLMLPSKVAIYLKFVLPPAPAVQEATPRALIQGVLVTGVPSPSLSTQSASVTPDSSPRSSIQAAPVTPEPSPKSAIPVTLKKQPPPPPPLPPPKSATQETPALPKSATQKTPPPPPPKSATQERRKSAIISLGLLSHAQATPTKEAEPSPTADNKIKPKLMR